MINEAQAIGIARERARELGWAFSEPIAVVSRAGWRAGSGRFEIETNAGHRGTKARFTVDAATGRILEEGYIPR